MQPSPPDLAALSAEIAWPDRDAGRRSADRLPTGVPGLRPVVEWLAAVQEVVPPRVPGRVRLVQFGSPGSAVTAQLAADAGVGVRVLDELPAEPTAATAAGVSVADREVDSGADLVIATGPGNAVAALVVIATLTDTEPARVVARGSAATDPATWMAQVAQVRDRRRLVARLAERPGELLVALGDPTTAAATGFILQCAVRRTPVLLDGLAAIAAALVGQQTQPRLARWLRVATESDQPAHALAIERLEQRPLLDLKLDCGDGLGALLTLPVVRAATLLAGDGPAPASHPSPGRSTRPSPRPSPRPGTGSGES